MSRETILRCHADYSARPAPANKYCSQTTGRATGSTRRHRPAALLALLYCILCFVQTATHRAGPGVPTADGAAEQQHQSTVHELLLLPARRSASDRSSRRLLSSANLEPLLVEGLEQSNDKADGLPENLIGSGSSFAAALHSDAMTAYSQHVYPKLPSAAGVTMTMTSHQQDAGRDNNKENTSIRMKYYPLSSSRGRCRFQNFEEECDPDDVAPPRKEDGPFAFAASDSPYTLEYHRKYPSHQVFPVAASAVVAAYNMPDESSSGQLELAIDLPTLAKIFAANITSWRHPDILRLNPAVADSLPDEDIHVVVRNGGSGTTAIFKTPLVKHHPLFEEQKNRGALESGGPEGWPAGEAGKFIYKGRNSEIGFALLAKPYSIGYIVHYEAVNLGLSMFTILEDCMRLRLDLQGVAKAVDEIKLPDDYYGLSEAEKATLKSDMELPARYRTTESFQWPFIGFTYIIIHQGNASATHEGDNVPSCNQMKLMAEYMVWFYESDIMREIAATHMFGTLSKPVRKLLVTKLREMTCEGHNLVDESKLKVFDEDLQVEVALTTTKDIEHLVSSRFIIFRTQEPVFRAVTTVKDGVNSTQPLQIDEDFRLLSVPGKVNLPEAASLPWILSALVVRANLPDGRESFLLDLETLGMIFRGEVASWDDPKLVALNPDFEDPIFDGERIILLSNLNVLGLMNDILDVEHDEATEGQPAADMDISMVMAQLGEQEFALAALPGYAHGTAFGALARLATESAPGGVEPTRDSVEACLAEAGAGLINRARQGCYPLVFSVNVFLHTKYAENANERGRLATFFWYNALKNTPDVEDLHWLIIHVYQSDRTPSKLKEEMERTIFSIQYSDGTAILKKYKPSMFMTIVIASVSAVIFVLILVLILVGVLFWRMQRRLARITMMESEQFDTEAPAIKVMKFLQGIASGKKLNRESAQELLAMLRHTRHLQTPDIMSQVRRMKQARGTNDHMSAGIGNYLIQMLNEDKSWQYLSARKSFMTTDFSFSRIQDQSVLLSINEILERACDPLASPQDLLKLVSTTSSAYFFNPMYLQAISGKRPLSTITMCLLHECGLIQGLKLDREKLVRYMLAIEDNYYPNNPYHNAIHAAFVVHCTCVTLRKLEIGSTHQDMTLMLSALIGAAVHDVLHPGVSNGYLVKAEAGVARDFNDQAVLENSSLRMALELMRLPETSFLEGSLVKSSRKQMFKSHLIKVVLATDMSMHFNVVSSFQQKVSFETEKIEWGYLTVDQKELVIQMSVKAADVGHCMARVKQHLYWSKCLEDEFFLQGDAERQANLEISPMMDRENPGILWPKNQIGFFAVIVVPMLEVFAATFPAVEPLLLQAHANVAYWKQAEHRFKPQPAEKYLADMMGPFLSRKRAILHDERSDLDCDPAPEEPSLEGLPSALKKWPIDAVCTVDYEIEELIRAK